jgi:hypothetical protein
MARRSTLAKARFTARTLVEWGRFYCWTPDVEGLYDELAAAGVEVGDVTRPFYMPAGEFRAEDPDGYVPLVGQLDDAG